MTSLRVLILEDEPDDAELMAAELGRGGFDVEWTRVETEETFLAALEADPDVTLVDNALPTFGAAAALRVLQERGSDVPLVVVSGTLPDDAALALVRQGAADYVLKDRMARLSEAVAGAIERRQLRRELHEQAARLRLLAGQAPGVVWIADRDLRCVFVGGRDAPLLPGDPGRSSPAAVGAALGLEGDPAAGHHAHRRALEGSSGSYRLAIGERVYQCSVEPLREDGSDVTSVGGVAIDVTERERAEEQLREAEAKYRALVERIPAVTYIDVVDDPGARGPVVYLSPQVEGMLGYTPEEFVRDTSFWAQIVHPDDREAATEADDRHYRTGEPLDHEYRVTARDGRVVWIRDLATMVTDEENRQRYSQGVLFDVTEQHRNEATLRANSERIRRLFAGLVEAQERERASVASDIHDDTIQIMTAVGMRLELLRRRFEDPADQELFTKVEETVGESISRLRHLLFELRPRALDEEGLGVALRQHIAAAEDDLEVELDYGLSEEPTIEARAVLYRIAQEAMTNARKHAQAGHLVVGVEEREDGLLLRVRDDGHGFDADRVQESAPGHLGLSSMRERAEMAGGWLSVTSAPGAGTTVECWIPSAPAP